MGAAATVPFAALADDVATPAAAAVDTLLLPEYHPVEAGTGWLDPAEPGTDRLKKVLEEAEQLRQERLGTARLGVSPADSALSRPSAELGSADMANAAGDEAEGGSFLDALLEQDDPGVAPHQVAARVRSASSMRMARSSICSTPRYRMLRRNWRRRSPG